MPTIPRRSSTSKQRLLTVANRLPITIKKGEGDYTYSISSGGLVTGLSGLPKDSYDTLWYGWAGLDVPEEDVAKVEAEIMKAHGGIPLWINNELMDLHYNGYSNGILWPLFHYHANDMQFEEEPWNAYVEVNRQFARRVAQDVCAGDIVWAHDYHLMLFPRMLREELGEDLSNEIKIGFFLHTPFPSSAEFCKLPYREIILEGLLHADLVGFHTYDYARHFLSACTKALKLVTSPCGVQFKRRAVHVGAFPIGINPEKELKLLDSQSVIEKVKRWKAGAYADKSVIISVDRLDYIKGLPHKFHAFDMFLEQYPDQIGKVVLVQIAVPSRQDVKEYQVLRSHISELAGRINAKYGNIDYTPIVYQYRSVSPDELIALYAMSDICLVTSTRDGMNLVAYEYIACQRERHGSLVLSEFAGAAQTMKGCIQINPWDTGEIMEGVRKALEMDGKQREENWLKMNEYVMKFTSAYWGTSFIEELSRIGSQELQEVKMRTRSDRSSTPSTTASPNFSAQSRRSSVEHNALVNGIAEPEERQMVDGV